MIDVEARVYTRIKNVLSTNVDTASKYTDVPSAFPHVSVVESNNVLYSATSDTSGLEHHAELTYDINIYSIANNQKAECREIAKRIDEEMKAMGFVRTLMNQVPNMQRDIYRILLRYRGIVATDNEDNTYYVYSK